MKGTQPMVLIMPDFMAYFKNVSILNGSSSAINA